MTRSRSGFDETCAATILLVAAVSPVRAQEQRIEPILIELKLGRLAERTVPAHRSGSRRPRFHLVRSSSWPSCGSSAARARITAIVQPGNRRFEVHAVQRTLSIDGRTTALGPRDFLVQDNEIFLSTRVLGQALALHWDVSWPDLEVVVIDPEELPIGRRVRRKQMAMARLGVGDDSARADGRLKEKVWPLEGVVADYSALVPSNPGPEGGAYSGTLGFTLFGGSLVAGVQNEGPVKDGNVRLDALVDAGLAGQPDHLPAPSRRRVFQRSPDPRPARNCVGERPLHPSHDPG